MKSFFNTMLINFICIVLLISADTSTANTNSRHDLLFSENKNDGQVDQKWFYKAPRGMIQKDGNPLKEELTVYYPRNYLRNLNHKKRLKQENNQAGQATTLQLSKK